MRQELSRGYRLWEINVEETGIVGVWEPTDDDGEGEQETWNVV